MPKIDIFGDLADQEKRRGITLTITEDCNLRCRYCYEPDKNPRTMSRETIRDTITHFMAVEDEFDKIEFDFFGGEPMLAFELIRDTVEWFHTQTWPKEHLFFITTNGTVLTDEMKAWLIERKGCVQAGISLDGNKTAHDLNRSNSYDRVRRNLPFFMEHYPTQPVKMTISAETIPYVADSIIELEEMGVPFTANVVFENIWGALEQKAALLETYAQQLDRLVEYYVAHPELYPARVVGVPVEHASTDMRARRQSDGECIRWCGAGHAMMTVETDGSRCPCHRFSTWITKRPLPAEPVNHQTSWKPEKCDQCKLLAICPICAGFNWQENGDSGIRTTYHCESFKLEAQASAKLQALRMLQQPPAEVASLSTEDAYALKCRIDGILEFASEGI